MSYHIDTGLIKEKVKVPCECPLCEIKAIVEEQIVHEFLNDAVMDDDMRTKVINTGFCGKHYDMMFARQNKLSLALQIEDRLNTMLSAIDGNLKNPKSAKKEAEKIDALMGGCLICKYVDQSMNKYYEAFAEVFARDNKFRQDLTNCKGFCMEHYSALLKYSSKAGFSAKEYVEILSQNQYKNLQRIKADLKTFCIKHDYRNREMPWGTAEDILPRTRIKLYGKPPTTPKK